MSGCCDCGDLEAWKAEGTCTEHSQKQVQMTRQEIVGILGEALVGRITMVIQLIVMFYCQ